MDDEPSGSRLDVVLAYLVKIRQICFEVAKITFYAVATVSMIASQAPIHHIV